MHAPRDRAMRGGETTDNNRVIWVEGTTNTGDTSTGDLSMVDKAPIREQCAGRGLRRRVPPAQQLPASGLARKLARRTPPKNQDNDGGIPRTDPRPCSPRRTPYSKPIYPRYLSSSILMDAHLSAGRVLSADVHSANAVSYNKGGTRPPRTSQTTLSTRWSTPSTRGSFPCVAQQPQWDHLTRKQKPLERSSHRSDRVLRVEGQFGPKRKRQCRSIVFPMGGSTNKS